MMPNEAVRQMIIAAYRWNVEALPQKREYAANLKARWRYAVEEVTKLETENAGFETWLIENGGMPEPVVAEPVAVEIAA